MKKLLSALLCVVSLPLLGSLPRPQAKVLASRQINEQVVLQQQKTAQHYKAQVTALKKKVGMIRFLLAQTEQERLTQGATDVVLVGYLDDFLKELNGYRNKLGAYGLQNILYDIGKASTLARTLLTHFVEKLKSETTQLYKAGLQYHNAPQQEKESIMAHLTRLNSLYNALANAKENLADKKTQETLNESYQRLFVTSYAVV